MKKPNFFIVGMPRAGTTSLYRYLAQHPDIFMSPNKEPHFFGSDLTPGKICVRLNEDKYLSLFSDVHDEKILGEASVEYLGSGKAAEEIHHFNPNAKILISLRNPVDQCYSYYCKHRLIELESGKDFSQAIDDNRKLETPYGWFREALEYKKNIKNLPDNIRRYLTIFGSENVKIIFFEDLQQKTADIYREILLFLGINPDFVPSFKIHNEHRVIRFKWLYHHYLRLKSDALLKNHPWLKKQLKRLYLHKLWHAPLDWYLFAKRKSRPELSPELRKKLTEEFLPTVRELEIITGRDLSAWKVFS